MKKRILLAFSAILILGLTIAVFAYNKTNSTNQATMDCCKKSDSCPMKSKNADVADKQNVSCCDKDDCCCKGGGDSCPMKQKQTAQTTDMQIKNITVVSDAENCCTKGADCCKDGGACCKNHKKS